MAGGSPDSDVAEWVFSKPLLVEGSMTPPPSVSLPGTTCYLVKCWARGAPAQVYNGLGPTPRVAKKAARIIAEVCHETLHYSPVIIVSFIMKTSIGTRQQQPAAESMPIAGSSPSKSGVLVLFYVIC